MGVIENGPVVDTRTHQVLYNPMKHPTNRDSCVSEKGTTANANLQIPITPTRPRAATLATSQLSSSALISPTPLLFGQHPQSESSYDNDSRSLNTTTSLSLDTDAVDEDPLISYSDPLEDEELDADVLDPTTARVLRSNGSQALCGSSTLMMHTTPRTTRRKCHGTYLDGLLDCVNVVPLDRF